MYNIPPLHNRPKQVPEHFALPWERADPVQKPSQTSTAPAPVGTGSTPSTAQQQELNHQAKNNTVGKALRIADNSAQQHAPQAPIQSATPDPNQAIKDAQAQAEQRQQKETDKIYKLQQQAAQQQLLNMNAQIQAMNNQLSSKLQAAGMNGGAYNAMMSINSRDMAGQYRGLAYELTSNMLIGLAERQSAKDAEEQANFAQFFSKAMAEGDFDTAMNTAQLMAELYPEDTFWGNIANNPEAQNILKKSMSVEAINRFTQFQQLGLDTMDTTTQWGDIDSIVSNMDTLINYWKEGGGADTLKLKADTWASNANNLDEMLDRVGYSGDRDLTNIPDSVLEKAYTLDWLIENKQKPMVEEFVDNMIASGSYNIQGFSKNSMEMLGRLVKNGALSGSDTLTIGGYQLNADLFAEGASASILAPLVTEGGWGFDDKQINESLNQIWASYINQGKDTVDFSDWSMESFIDEVVQVAVDKGIYLADAVAPKVLDDIAKSALKKNHNHKEGTEQYYGKMLDEPNADVSAMMINAGTNPYALENLAKALALKNYPVLQTSDPATIYDTLVSAEKEKYSSSPSSHLDLVRPYASVSERINYAVMQVNGQLQPVAVRFIGKKKGTLEMKIGLGEWVSYDL